MLARIKRVWLSTRKSKCNLSRISSTFKLRATKIWIEPTSLWRPFNSSRRVITRHSKRKRTLGSSESRMLESRRMTMSQIKMGKRTTLNPTNRSQKQTTSSSFTLKASKHWGIRALKFLTRANRSSPRAWTSRSSWPSSFRRGCKTLKNTQPSNKRPFSS